MHSYRKIASVPGTATLICCSLSSVPLTGEARPDGRGATAGLELCGFMSSCLSWTIRGRSCSSGLLVPLFCQYRQLKLNKDVY